MNSNKPIIKQLFIRRFLLPVIAGAALLSSGVSALCEEVDWETLEKELEDSSLKGDFVSIRELGLKMWLPDYMEEADLEESLQDAGYLHYYKAEGKDDTAAVSYVDLDGVTLTEYEEMVEDAGGINLQEIDLNGLGALTYELKDSDLYAVSFVTQKGYVLEFLFYPVSDDAYADAVRFMTGSIMSDTP